MTKFFGTVNKNKFSPYNFEQHWNYLSTLEGKEVFCVIEKKTNSRYLLQNNLYWLKIEILASHTGHSKDEMHEMMKHKHLPKKQMEIVNKITGEVETIEIPPSTKSLSTKEMGTYMDEIDRWSYDFLSIILPTPDDILQ